MSAPRAAVFHSPAPPWSELPRAAAGLRARYGDQFASPREANQFFRNMVVPACGSWVFVPNGKTGTSSTLFFLFHLMFGVPLTTRTFSETQMPAASGTAHHLVEARVFARLALIGEGRDPVQIFDQALRLCTVRDPFARAVSGFRYLCLSQEKQAPQFLEDRQRLCAMTGFHWDRDPGREAGFLRFLDYIEASLPHHDSRPVDSHFRPQVMNLRLEVTQPHLIGRCEDLPGFFRESATRLDRPLPEGLDLDARHNRQPDAGRAAFDTPATRARVAELFAADYDALGYEA